MAIVAAPTRRRRERVGLLISGDWGPLLTSFWRRHSSAPTSTDRGAVTRRRARRRPRLVLVALAIFGLGLLAAPRHVLAATRTWTGLGATSNWSLAANWSGAVVPVAADTVVFDATSVKDVTIDVNVSVASVTVGAGYTGTLTQSAGRTVTVGAAGWNQAGGTFAGGTAAITVNGPF
jgi:hypothetical protein